MRGCSCGGTCPRCSGSPGLGLSQPGEALERSADAMADQALQASGLAGVESSDATGPKPLPPGIRGPLQRHFGMDLGHVRLHEGPYAQRSAHALGAQAYTRDSQIVMGEGWQPGTPRGQRLLAHEVAHAVQGARGQASSRVAYRQVGMEPGNMGMTSSDADLAAERAYGDKGAPNAQHCGRPPHCPPGFCDPYRSEELARYYRARNGPLIMAGIWAAVNSRVVPLWRDYLNGGSMPRNLTSQFGADFTASPTTRQVTQYIRQSLRTAIAARPPPLPVGGVQALDIAATVPAAARAIDDPDSPQQMNFSIPRDVPGNLAGGIGKDQTTCASGALPSPFDDQRLLGGTATVTRTTPGTLQVTPDIQYSVFDAIDLCPGDCGTRLEQVATVPLSQFEATGISGDVPFGVNFPAPEQTPFDVPAAAPTAPLSPAPGAAAAPVPAPPPPVPTLPLVPPPSPAAKPAPVPTQP